MIKGDADLARVENGEIMLAATIVSPTGCEVALSLTLEVGK